MTLQKNTEETNFNYESIEPGYYDAVYKKQTGIQSKWHHLKFSFIKEKLENYTDHLDIGCGPGTFIGSLDQNKKSTGIDISLNQIEYAKSHYASPTHQFVHLKDSTKYPFPKNTFDVITLMEVIEHLNKQDIINILKNALTLAKPHGKIILTTPNYRSLWPLLEFIINKTSSVSYEEQHISKFNKRTLLQLLSELGIKNYTIRKFQLLAPFVASLSWRLADKIFRIENTFFSKLFGSLIVVEIYKPLEEH